MRNPQERQARSREPQARDLNDDQAGNDGSDAQQPMTWRQRGAYDLRLKAEPPTNPTSIYDKYEDPVAAAKRYGQAQTGAGVIAGLGTGAVVAGTAAGVGGYYLGHHEGEPAGKAEDDD
jgi:hypothetical protein